MIRNRKLLSILSCYFICVMIISAMIPITCLADEKENKIVRVGYVLTPGYEEGAEGEYKTGYGYEYLQKLAGINGWTYEYVYGSFSDLFEKLQIGEIDLMGNLSYTDERAESISYGANEQGKENNYLYVNKNDNLIKSSDYSTINGKKIGVPAGTNQEKIWMEWCEENQIDCQIVQFANYTDCMTALNNNEIDAAIGGVLQRDADTADWQVIMNFGFSPFYFGVNKQRPDLLDELNRAQKKILEQDPFYNDEIYARYVKSASLIATTLGDDEKEWINNNHHQIKIGYLEGFPPLCYQDDEGAFKGVAADVFDSIEKLYAEEEIHFEAITYSDYNTMFNDLKKGTISVAWPAYDDSWTAEQLGYVPTDCVVSAPMMLIYNEEYTDDTETKIGVINTGSLPKIYANINYPKSEIHEYDSYESAIDALINNEVFSVLYVSTTYNVDVETNKTLQQLNMTILSNSCEIALGVAQGAEELVSILNKGITAFGDAGVNHSLITNSVVNKKITLKDFFEHNPVVANLLIGVMLVLIAGIIILFVYYKMSIRVKTSQAEKEVYEEISNSDPVTGLYNRRAVFRKCQELLKEHPDEQFVMTHIDMSHFRLFNTFFGDEAGDKLLCDIADLFRGLSKDYKYWAYGRIEADVFCAFFPYDQNKYEKHVAAILKYLQGYRSDFLIEPKLGIYFVTDPQMPMESMFTRATLAAREVKPHTPYATVIYDEKLEKGLNEKQQIINEMQMAIDQEQFKVYLQPKYALRTNKVVGAEALVRWIHPTKGMISPGVFIPVFESNGFITTLDRYMWEHVCQILSKWQNEGKPMVPISVNVSRLSMFGSKTVNFLKELIAKYNIEPKYLELELTESAYIDDPEEMKAQMQALKEAGFTILLDDFGSGYSSLNTLREIPVDVLKMDMKFLSLEKKDLRGGLVISSIIRMAKLLNLLVIAEGVEIQEQADYLKEVGCEYVQGFLFSRPVPVSDYEKMLTSGYKPLVRINQPAIEHIGHILAETGTSTHELGAVMPTPLACLEYSEGNYRFLRVNPDFYEEFNIEGSLQPASQIFKTCLTEKSYLKFIQAIEESIKSTEKILTSLVWKSVDGTNKKYYCRIAYEGSIGESATLIVIFMRVTDDI